MAKPKVGSCIDPVLSKAIKSTSPRSRNIKDMMRMSDKIYGAVKTAVELAVGHVDNLVKEGQIVLIKPKPRFRSPDRKLCCRRPPCR